MRGRNIYHHMHYEDCGAFQFYEIGLNNLVIENTMARGGGFLAWGQWRRNAGAVNINLMNQYIGNEITEGARAEHRSTVPLADKPWGDALQNSGAGFAVVDNGNTSANIPIREVDRLIVFRRNKIWSNGGFLVGPATDVLVENSEVANTPSGSFAQAKTNFQVSSLALGVLLVNNTDAGRRSNATAGLPLE